MSSDVERRARRIRLVVFDVDGVLTDGSIAYTDKGDEIKSFNVQDGSAVKRLLGSGIEVALITGRRSPMVERRARELGIRHLYSGVSDKVEALTRLLEHLGIDATACAYVGDDVPDLAVFDVAGLAVSVPNGHPHARRAAHHVTARAGGYGAAADVCDLILSVRNPSPAGDAAGAG